MADADDRNRMTNEPTTGPDEELIRGTADEGEEDEFEEEGDELEEEDEVEGDETI